MPSYHKQYIVPGQVYGRRRRGDRFSWRRLFISITRVQAQGSRLHTHSTPWLTLLSSWIALATRSPNGDADYSWAVCVLHSAARVAVSASSSDRRTDDCLFVEVCLFVRVLGASKVQSTSHSAITTVRRTCFISEKLHLQKM
jgi:hypothetical protein